MPHEAAPTSALLMATGPAESGKCCNSHRLDVAKHLRMKILKEMNLRGGENLVQL